MAKFSARGTKLLIGDGGGPEVFTPVVQLDSVGGFGLTQNTEDTTDHDSPEFAEEHVETTRSYGNISCSGNWDPTDATHDEATGIWSKFKNDGPHNFKVFYPNIGANGTEIGPFLASVVNLSFGDAPVSGKLPISFELKVSGIIPDPLAL